MRQICCMQHVSSSNLSYLQDNGCLTRVCNATCVAVLIHLKTYVKRNCSNRPAHKLSQAPRLETFFLLNSIEREIFPAPVVGILTFMSGKNYILGISEPKKPNFLIFFILISFKILCSTKLSMKKVLQPRGLVRPRTARLLNVH